MGKGGASWDKMLAELVAFKDEHGHCNVPTNYPDNPSLGRWVASRRYKRKVDDLPVEQIEALDRMGFVWQPSEQAWLKMYDALVVFHKKHGHCNVPETWEKNPSLASWVQSQRHRRRKGRLSFKRIEKLDRLGFTWAIYKRGLESRADSGSSEEPMAAVQEPPRQKLYWIRNGSYLQYDGTAELPDEIRDYMQSHHGEPPPYIPLPPRPTTFYIGVRYVREKEVHWKAPDPLPAPVLRYVKTHGTLPPHD